MPTALMAVEEMGRGVFLFLQKDTTWTVYLADGENRIAKLNNCKNLEAAKRYACRHFNLCRSFIEEVACIARKLRKEEGVKRGGDI